MRFLNKQRPIRTRVLGAIALLGLVGLLLGTQIVQAGNLTPSTSPGSTMHTLSELAGSGFSTATHSLKALYNKISGLVADIWNRPTSQLTTGGSVGKLVVNNLDMPVSDVYGVLSGTYDASGVTANASGNIEERLEFIMQNLGGYTYGSSNAAHVLTVAGGTYDATSLTPANVRSGVSFGDGQTGTYGGSWLYGSNDATKVLTTADAAGTYNASNLSASTVKSGTSFGASLTGDYPSSTYPLPGAVATTDLAASGGNVTSSNGSVEWWQSDGTRQTATLDFPTLSNVCSIDTSNNSSGTLSVTAAYIAVGNTYCGTAGTLLANLFNGTSGSFTGGSQANGGADDYNDGGSPTSGRYAMGWTACTSGNIYCGTGDSGADARDDSTGLIWSLPCNGSGCSSFSDSSPATYTWDNSGESNNSRTASQLCSDHAGWYLPHQKQLMQAYINGSYGNLENTGDNLNYWSATTNSASTTAAYYTILSKGYTSFIAKTFATAINVRCVRPAN